MQRREFMHKSSGATALGLAAVAGLSHPGAAAQSAPGWNQPAFEGRSLAEVVKALGGGVPALSADVALDVPEISENGGMVRVGVRSAIPGTTQLAIVIEKNPAALAALFNIPAGTDAGVATNVKMAQSSNVYAVARAGEKSYYAVRDVKVTLGGCG